MNVSVDPSGGWKGREASVISILVHFVLVSASCILFDGGPSVKLN